MEPIRGRQPTNLPAQCTPTFGGRPRNSAVTDDALSIMHRPIRGAFALLAVTPLAAAAQSLLAPRDAGPAEHAPIAIEAALEWRSVLERAVRNYPRFIELEARRHESTRCTAARAACSPGALRSRSDTAP